MDVSLFDFDLPERAIALRPAQPRDHAKLLQVDGAGRLSHHRVTDLTGLLRAGDVLVFNETKVFPAALQAIRPARAQGGGGDVRIGVNLHKARGEGEGEWEAFVRPAKRLKSGDKLYFPKDLARYDISSTDLVAEVKDIRTGGDVTLAFNLSGAALDAAFASVGAPPLPPYIARKRAPDARDISDYQTVYAKVSGSVAAPTAGLHFTPILLEALAQAGVQMEYLTLHVGAGTFLPVKSEDTKQHNMHAEWFEITPQVAARISAAKAEGRRIIAVGTTALRALESAFEGGELQAQRRETDIFLTPGAAFHIVDGLMTNFHLPKSTLFMLVSALAGLEVMQEAYRTALEADYRFYSYGDSSLIWKAA